MRYFKFLTDKMTGGHTDFVWPIDEWVAVSGELKFCENGFHILAEKHYLPEWTQSQLFEVELDHKAGILKSDDKWCCRKVRLVKKIDTWNEKTKRLFVADCAAHVLSRFEKLYPTDRRPRQAIEAARLFAAGKITSEQLKAAADAAYRAADEVAVSLTNANAHHVAASSAAKAAWAAAYDPSGDASEAISQVVQATRDAIWLIGQPVWASPNVDFEQRWQTRLFLNYVDGKRGIGLN